MRVRLLISGIFALICSCVQAEPQDPKFYAQRGMQAGHAYPGLANICDIFTPLKMAGSRPRQEGGANERRERASSRAAFGPMQVFDNLYFVGTSGVSSWALKTSEGLILIDALNNDDEAQRYIDAGLRTLGLDPADIRYLLITHGHGDHYGGQAYLVEKFKPRVVMSEQDWQELEKPKLEFSNPRWGQPPKRDMAVKDGDLLTLGDTRVQLYVTPGHTPGTLSLIFSVHDQGVEHKVALWGGTGLNFGTDRQRILAYSASAERFRLLAKEQGADIFMSNHPARDGARERLPMLKQRKPGEPHPFVVESMDVEGAFELLRDCSYAQALKLDTP
ncbi:MBL fold metallo-hydrolase [Ectopseudomonas khazarica]|uniref:MBL fold metallo-hydrolase n=1 Tax=Ectopseudomonas khazarica TaxID=2502979 RepID=A0ABW7MJI4_9GAMM